MPRCTTQLYDRRRDDVTRDQVKRIVTLMRGGPGRRMGGGRTFPICVTGNRHAEAWVAPTIP